MKTVFLFEDADWQRFCPLALSRPVYRLRIGIDLISEKWARHLPQQRVLGLAGSWLAAKYHASPKGGDTALYINGRLLPNPALATWLLDRLSPETAVYAPGGQLLAFASAQAGFFDPEAGRALSADFADDLEPVPADGLPEYRWLEQITDLFRMNGAQLAQDWQELTAGRSSAPITDPHTRVYQPERIFLEPGATVTAAILNPAGGYIYLGKDSEVAEGAIIHGSHALCEHANVGMGAKLRGDSTIGPWCKVGGEVSNSIFYAYSNKGHDGFIGNALIGEWCNLGADTNCSNLKNNYGEVTIYSYQAHGMVKTGLQFVGLLMGDHSKAGINTMFNTGTVVGFSANVFGAGFPPKHIRSYGWGGAEDLETYALPQAKDTARRMASRRGLCLSQAEEAIFDGIWEYERPVL